MNGTHAPQRRLDLAELLSALHHSSTHHLSASECPTLGLPALLAYAGPEDMARWEALDFAYTDPHGAPWLRATIAGTYDQPQQIVTFAGAQEGLYASLHTVLGPGSHAIAVVPGYQAVETLCLGLAATTGVALDPAGWSLDIAAVAAAIRPNTRLVCISFPNNPTGAQLPPDRLAALVALCRHHGVWLLSDEVYRHMEHDPATRAPQIADLYERGISIGVLSKTYGLAGLRLGWVACADRGMAERIGAFRQYLSVCSASPSEVLANIAIKAADPITARNRAIALANLPVVDAFLARNPLFSWHAPRAGIVGYMRYAGAEGVEAFATRMAAAGISLLPASVFRSDLCALPSDHFRLGFGHPSFAAGLAAMAAASVASPYE